MFSTGLNSPDHFGQSDISNLYLTCQIPLSKSAEVISLLPASLGVYTMMGYIVSSRITNSLLWAEQIRKLFFSEVVTNIGCFTLAEGLHLWVIQGSTGSPLAIQGLSSACWGLYQQSQPARVETGLGKGPHTCTLHSNPPRGAGGGSETLSAMKKSKTFRLPRRQKGAKWRSDWCATNPCPTECTPSLREQLWLRAPS